MIAPLGLTRGAKTRSPFQQFRSSESTISGPQEQLIVVG